MALPEHSPQRPFTGPTSPVRPFNAPAESQLPPPVFGPRQMLPPSPQHFQPRYPQAPSTTALPSPGHQPEPQGLPPAQKRQGGSMSISSMLFTEADKPSREQQPPPPQQQPQHQHQHQQHQQHQPNNSHQPMGTAQNIPGNPGAMSPPQFPSKPSIAEYSYKPRSHTPDRINYLTPAGSRPHRSSSGTMMQRPGPFDDQTSNAAGRAYFPRFGEPQTSSSQDQVPRHESMGNQGRRTSISDIVERPNSQPQPPISTSKPSPSFLPASRPLWGDQPSVTRPSPPPASTNSLGAENSSLRYGTDGRYDNGDRPRQDAAMPYDTRPPGASGQPRQAFGLPGRDIMSPQLEGPTAASVSPEERRQVLYTPSNRGFGNILNGPPPSSNPYQSTESALAGPPSMARQDSGQSQPDRAGLVERIDRRSRFFSPFASSIGLQSYPGTSVPPEEQSRKGSDELSQHRALLNLANETKRGRYSPVPQAVQGAQAQTPVPDTGIKTEHGKVFSGLGSGIGSTSSAPTIAPPGLSASPFKRDEGISRLSEDNLMKMSRSTPGLSKRPRKFKEDEGPAPAESEPGNGRKTTGPMRGAKRGKHQHHYRLDGEEENPHRPTPTTTLNPIRRTTTPTLNPRQHLYQPRQPVPTPQRHNFKPTTTIKISSVLQSAARHPRKHLGSFVYSPRISTPDIPPVIPSTSRRTLNVSIQPTILPSFRDPDHINCTYTIRVSRTWLRHPEREAICSERFVWGSAIFTDDSDPIAAAVHAGFVKAAFPENTDTALLEQIIKTQTPIVDAGQEEVPKDGPVSPEAMEKEGKGDLRITLVVLPQLEGYRGSVRFGLRSRDWPGVSPKGDAGQTKATNGAHHDGISFMVLRCEWVDEAGARGKERSGEARRKRLDGYLKERKGTVLAKASKQPPAEPAPAAAPNATAPADMPATPPVLHGS